MPKIKAVSSTLIILGLFLFPSTSENSLNNHSINIAVLPVENNIDNPEIKPLVYGESYEIVKMLSYINPICVKPLSKIQSSKEFSIVRIAKDVRADFVLKNEIKKKRSKNKIFFQLLRIKEEKAEVFNSSQFEPRDFDSLKFYISKEILEALKIDLKERDINGKINGKIRPETYKFYFNSLYWHNIFLKEKRKEYFELSMNSISRALELNDRFAPLYASIEGNALLQIEYRFSNDPTLLEFAIEMCNKALELDRELLRARSILGILYMKKNKKRKLTKN